MKILFGTLVYLVATFPLAYFWHMKFFADKYLKWEYAGKDPSIALGFLSMVFQGMLLSWMYAQAPIEHTSTLAGVCFALLLGLFFWTTHVVAAMAKNHQCRNRTFFVYETIYLLLQFGIYGFLMSSLVY